MNNRFLGLIVVSAFVIAGCAANTEQTSSPVTEPAVTDDSPAGDAGIAARAAREALAAELGVHANDIAVESTESREWSDSCLGLGQAHESCLAAITPGFAMTLMHGGTEYRYRTNVDGTSVRAE